MEADSNGGLSLAVRLGALNDFLEPSQDCVVDLERPRLIKLNGNSVNGATVNVADCLACNGCVTTAEAVLLNTHNYGAFIQILEARRHREDDEDVDSATERPPQALPTARPPSAPPTEEPTSAPQVAEGPPPASTTQQIVLSLTSVVESSLMALWNFADRESLYGSLKEAIPEVDLICSCDLAEQLASEYGDSLSSVRSISSHCPGVVLYAEKFEHHAIPYIDTAPSVQCWQGAIVKDLLQLPDQSLRPKSSYFWDGLEGHRPPSRTIYHIIVNSCADKKLELFRPEFSGLIDLALTTDEFLLALTEMKIYLEIRTRLSLRHWDLSARLARYFGFVELQKFNLQRSCGFLVAKELDPSDQPHSSGSDFIQWLGTKLSCATGLRNLKNFMAKHRIEKLMEDSRLDLMACPKGGCFSGAGQAHIYRNGELVRERAEALFTNVRRFGCIRPKEAIELVCRSRKDFLYHVKEAAAPPGSNSMNDW